MNGIENIPFAPVVEAPRCLPTVVQNHVIAPLACQKRQDSDKLRLVSEGAREQMGANGSKWE